MNGGIFQRNGFFLLLSGLLAASIFLGLDRAASLERALPGKPKKIKVRSPLLAMRGIRTDGGPEEISFRRPGLLFVFRIEQLVKSQPGQPAPADVWNRAFAQKSPLVDVFGVVVGERLAGKSEGLERVRFPLLFNVSVDQLLDNGIEVSPLTIAYRKGGSVEMVWLQSTTPEAVRGIQQFSRSGNP